jgi:hypothetical protein
MHTQPTDHHPAFARCDRSACPAPAARRVDLYGQDFYFCEHHWAEIADSLADQQSPTAAEAIDVGALLVSADEDVYSAV